MNANIVILDLDILEGRMSLMLTLHQCQLVSLGDVMVAFGLNLEDLFPS